MPQTRLTTSTNPRQPANAHQNAAPAVGRPPFHPSILVDLSLNRPDLLELYKLEMTPALIKYVVDTVINTVDNAWGRPSSSSRGRKMAGVLAGSALLRRILPAGSQTHFKLVRLATDVLCRAEVKVPVLLVTLVYIDRAQPRLQAALEVWARDFGNKEAECVFLGALMLASKFVNDLTWRNGEWARCTGVFDARQIGRIEREFLRVLDYNLFVHDADLLAHQDTLISLPRAGVPADATTI